MPLISALFLTFASCKRKYFTSDGSAWATTYHIVYSGDRSMDAEIAAVLDSVDRELSMFNPMSTVSRINACATDSVTDAFAEVFEVARRVNLLSGGVYDPTVGPLTELWGFGTGAVDSVPSDDAVAAALSAVGLLDCSISDGRVHKKSKATVFDFSSVAKGYGVDCVGRMFDRAGSNDYMIEIGGEVLARGFSPRGRAWRIQIDSPAGGVAHRRMAVLELGPEPKAVASSGNYRNYRSMADGKVYGHTISPVSGRPVAGNIVAVTVVADFCADADALATACMASCNADSAFAILSRAGAEGAVVLADADTLSVSVTPGFFRGS